MKQELSTVAIDLAKKISLNLSLFVEDRSGPKTGPILPSSLCWQWLGLMPPTRSAPSVRRHSADERSAETERSSHSPAGWFC